MNAHQQGKKIEMWDWKGSVIVPVCQRWRWWECMASDGRAEGMDMTLVWEVVSNTEELYWFFLGRPMAKLVYNATAFLVPL
jgi:hypothetical protein